MRLIDADALKADIEQFNRPLCDDYHMKDYVLYQIITDIENQPTVDAVPVIRCKDCIRWRQSNFDTTVMVCDWDRYERTEKDYCSWAKRKDDD